MILQSFGTFADAWYAQNSIIVITPLSSSLFLWSFCSDCRVSYNFSPLLSISCEIGSQLAGTLASPSKLSVLSKRIDSTSSLCSIHMFLYTRPFSLFLPSSLLSLSLFLSLSLSLSLSLTIRIGPKVLTVCIFDRPTFTLLYTVYIPVFLSSNQTPLVCNFFQACSFVCA